jgi:hypothetical protein
MVVNEKLISGPEKMQYLLMGLPDDLSRTFSKVEYTDESFQAAWKELKSRFNNKLMLIDRHLSKMFQQKPIEKDSASNLRQLIDNFMNNLAQLKLTGQDVDSWDMIVVHMIKFRLDEETRKLWQAKILTLQRLEADVENRLPT